MHEDTKTDFSSPTALSQELFFLNSKSSSLGTVQKTRLNSEVCTLLKGQDAEKHDSKPLDANNNVEHQGASENTGQEKQSSDCAGWRDIPAWCGEARQGVGGWGGRNCPRTAHGPGRRACPSQVARG